MNQGPSRRPPTTTDAGVPVASQEHSLTIGPDGPILLQDFYLIEQMANFNRERIPERQPHAKGGGAFGIFTVTDNVSRFTKAAVFQPGVETEVVLRFSTVAGERGSPDTWRDPRGFAVRFYTSEGNLDIVGNNTPVFFIRDPMKFQNFIRSQKRLAANNLRDSDMQWDFWTLSPESAHQVTWLMGDRGIPRSWRHMNGYSSHTYMWVNAEGERYWVKYHFKSDQGVECLTQADADRIAGEDGDYHQRDLYEAIERGEYPSWSLKIQVSAPHSVRDRATATSAMFSMTALPRRVACVSYTTKLTPPMLASVPVSLMGSGIGSIPFARFLDAASEAVTIAAEAGLVVDHLAMPLSDVTEAWNGQHGRGRVVFTIN